MGILTSRLRYCQPHPPPFHRVPERDTGGGWTDVWKRRHFAWEYKGQRADLDTAFGQPRLYALALENPPLLIVSDMLQFRIRTNWTNSLTRQVDNMNRPGFSGDCFS